jgi:hypothetical protein
MFIFLNDGRKVNMMWVATFYQEKNEVIYEMVKGQTVKVVESFGTEAEAKARIDELEDIYLYH